MLFQIPPPAPERFPPHPGTTTFRTAWNHSVVTQSADTVSDADKYVYYDSEGHETSDATRASTKVPVVEVEMFSSDAEGRLVKPARAVRVTITEYGPYHLSLRHSTGPGDVR